MEPRLEPEEKRNQKEVDEYYDVDSITIAAIQKAEKQYEAYLDRRWDK